MLWFGGSARAVTPGKCCMLSKLHGAPLNVSSIDRKIPCRNDVVDSCAKQRDIIEPEDLDGINGRFKVLHNLLLHKRDSRSMRLVNNVRPYCVYPVPTIYCWSAIFLTQQQWVESSHNKSYTVTTNNVERILILILTFFSNTPCSELNPPTQFCWAMAARKVQMCLAFSNKCVCGNNFAYFLQCRYIDVEHLTAVIPSCYSWSIVVPDY